MGLIEIFEVFVSGLMYCSVCTNITDKTRIEELTNEALLQTFGKKWKVCSDIVINGEEAVLKSMRQNMYLPTPPLLCDLILQTHKHYTLQCYDDKNTYKKSPEPKRLVKYNPVVVTQTDDRKEEKEPVRKAPLDRREAPNGEKFLEVTKRGKKILKLDSIVSTKDEIKQRRKTLRAIGKKIVIVKKNKPDSSFGVYVDITNEPQSL